MILLIKKRPCLVDSLEFFMKSNAPFASTISFSQRSRFVILDHEIEGNEFRIKIYYDKEQFVHLITQYVNEMICEGDPRPPIIMSVTTLCYFDG